jgi:hypothetical protein
VVLDRKTQSQTQNRYLPCLLASLIQGCQMVTHGLYFLLGTFSSSKQVLRTVAPRLLLQHGRGLTLNIGIVRIISSIAIPSPFLLWSGLLAGSWTVSRNQKGRLVFGNLSTACVPSVIDNHTAFWGVETRFLLWSSFRRENSPKGRLVSLEAAFIGL